MRKTTFAIQSHLHGFPYKSLAVMPRTHYLEISLENLVDIGALKEWTELTLISILGRCHFGIVRVDRTLLK